MATYLFNITLSGEGDNADEAWNHATEAFNMEPGCTPEDYEVLDDEDIEDNIATDGRCE